MGLQRWRSLWELSFVPPYENLEFRAPKRKSSFGLREAKKEEPLSQRSLFSLSLSLFTTKIENFLFLSKLRNL